MMTVNESRSIARSRLRSTCCWTPALLNVLLSLSVVMTGSSAALRGAWPVVRVLVMGVPLASSSTLREGC